MLPPVKGYLFVDVATQAYLAGVGLLILIFQSHPVPNGMLLVAAHLLGGGLIHWLIRAQARHRGNRVLEALRHFYPVLLYTALYRETAALNQMFHSGFLDPVFIQWEQRLWGGQPSLRLMEQWPNPVLSELLHAAYFSFYLMIAGIGVWLFCRERRQFHHFLAVLSFIFYTCYLLFIFLPVAGPRVFFAETIDPRWPAALVATQPTSFPAAIQSGFFFNILSVLFRWFEAPGAAFPSSHVAVAIATVYFSFLYLRPIRFLHAGWVGLLCLATVYCRYHYAVDVLAGFLTAAMLIPLGNRLYGKFNP